MISISNVITMDSKIITMMKISDIFVDLDCSLVVTYMAYTFACIIKKSIIVCVTWKNKNENFVIALAIRSFQALAYLAIS